MDNPYVTETHILSFSGSGHHFLCDDYACQLQIGDVLFPSVRNAILSYKTKDVAIKKKVAVTTIPADLKDLERSMPTPSYWTKHFILGMLRVYTYKKFKQNPELGKRLLATHPKKLVDALEDGLQRFQIDEIKEVYALEHGKIVMQIREKISF